MTATSVLAVVIKLPPEAIVPLLLASAALFVLTLGGSALRAWKQRSPGPAKKLGIVVGGALAVVSIVFLAKCLLNQSDPNNHTDATNLSFIDAPIAGFCAVIGALFFGFSDKPKLGRYLAFLVGALLFVKPFIWPVMRVWDSEAHARGAHDHAREMLDPEHLEFLVTGIVVMLVGLLASARPSAPRRPPPPSAPPPSGGAWPPPPPPPPR